MGDLSLGLGALLVLISLVAGVGITAVGPGGILVTIALYTLTPLAPAEVAGTALVTFTATGVLGSVAYLRSGELRGVQARHLAVVLSLTAVAGAFVGARLNVVLPPALFGPLLAAFTLAVGATVLRRSVTGRADRRRLDPASVSPGWRLAREGGTGTIIGALCGFLGVGGPVVAVPVLALLGVPLLTAIAVAQVQSVFLAASATVGYAVADAVSFSLALLVGLPQLVGVVIGWRVAHAVDPRRLRVALGVVLVLLAPILVVA